MVAPVVLAHVAQRRGHATLGGHGVRAGREDLGDACGLEALLGQTEGRAQSGATGTDHDHVEFVFLDLVSRHDQPPNAMRMTANTLASAASTQMKTTAIWAVTDNQAVCT